jgi:ribosome-binding protein aMBF1 (putative translation factor)
MTKKNKKAPPTTDATAILKRRFGDTADRRDRISQIKQDMSVGQQIYDARKAAGLTQAQLARRIGTTQSVISDLEDAEYEGHSLPMLRRVAEALDLSVRVSFVPAQEASPAHA